MWKIYYTRVRNRALNVAAHAASNTPPMDERINFGKEGSSMNHEPRVFPSSFYSANSAGGRYVQEE